MVPTRKHLDLHVDRAVDVHNVAVGTRHLDVVAGHVHGDVVVADGRLLIRLEAWICEVGLELRQLSELQLHAAHHKPPRGAGWRRSHCGPWLRGRAHRRLDLVQGWPNGWKDLPELLVQTQQLLVKHRHALHLDTSPLLRPSTNLSAARFLQRRRQHRNGRRVWSALGRPNAVSNAGATAVASSTGIGSGGSGNGGWSTRGRSSSKTDTMSVRCAGAAPATAAAADCPG
mmetsp:Transcript_66956/g.217895  ORF Transcript_66956/g.217895 Transcript_66956/m.217895 type:complete len:229 (-) Transcript_66956:379-1065(-)